jgi:hypothetical protein
MDKEITSITVVFNDGSIVSTSNGFTPVTAPTPEQIQDVVVENTDGTSEKFEEAPEALPADETAPTEAAPAA